MNIYQIIYIIDNEYYLSAVVSAINEEKARDVLEEEAIHSITLIGRSIRDVEQVYSKESL
jgi:hypothetical protein